MDTNFESTTQTISSQPPVIEPIEAGDLDLPVIDKKGDSLRITSQALEDFEAEGESIMSIPGSPHEKLAALAGGNIMLEELRKGGSKKENKTDKVQELSLEERVLKLQEELLKLMIARMKAEKKDPKKEDEIYKKLKKLLEEAEGEGKANILQSLMNITFMLYMISNENSSRA